MEKLLPCVFLIFEMKKRLEEFFIYQDDDDVVCMERLLSTSLGNKYKWNMTYLNDIHLVLVSYIS